MHDIELLYDPQHNKPMNVVVFASGGGNNLLTAIQTANNSSGKIKICLVVTDRLKIRAIEIANSFHIPVLAKDFEKECGVWKLCKDDADKALQYKKAAEHFHDSILSFLLKKQEEMNESIDLIVLSYHRLIQGKLLSHFTGRIINQHPADLTIMKDDNSFQRKYIGFSSVFDALADGNKKTRTTNFIVRAGCDDGEILCSGPWVDYKGKLPITQDSANGHELLQKKLSDIPVLQFVLKSISEGRYGIHRSLHHSDGNNVIFYNGKPTPYEGIDLSKIKRETYE